MREPPAGTHPSVERPIAAVGSRPAGGDRADMHRDLRERITDGTYSIDPGLVAEAIIVRMRRDRASAVFVAPQAPDLDAAGPEQRDAGPFGDPA